MIVEVSRRFRELSDAEVKDPESLMSLADAGLLRSLTWADVLRRPRVVLLAEAGSGKTFEMSERAKQLRAEGKPAFFLPLEALDDGTISDLLDNDEERAFNSWRTNDQSVAWLFLDAVDELKLTQGRLDRALRRVAKEIDGCLHRVHIVVSCRPTDWRPSLDLAAMRRAFPTTPAAVPGVPSEELFLSVLRKPERANPADDEDAEPTTGSDDTYFVALLPLDQPQIEAFAKALGVADVGGFVAELRRQDAWSFARRPFDLSELIATWKVQGRLGTRAEQHEANVAARLKDGPERPDRGVLTDAEVRVGAEQLALASSLTRTRTIRAPELTVDVDYAAGVLDSSSILVDWSEEKRQSLLRRALFDPATYGRVRFHHRSVQEYLAARRLNGLREKGMSTKALSRLLFAERYGVPVVVPSMRAIAAWLALWNEHVRRELMAREPETLLSMGDPESLALSARADLLRAFVRAYGSGSWRGLRIPIDEVRRLAHPELGSVVRELWGDGPTNDDVRELLLDLIEQGAMQQCADVCEQAARDGSLPEHHRYMAVRALASCRQQSAVHAIAQSIVNDPTNWPLGLVAQLVDDLFPDYLSAADVVRFAEMPSANSVRTGFSQSLRRIATIVAPLSQPAIELRDLLAKMILSGRDATKGGYRDGRFDHLAPALAILCSRQVEANAAGIDDALIEVSAVASRFAARATGGKETASRLRQHFVADVTLRSRVFWIEFKLTDSLDPSGDAWRRLRRMQQDSLVGDLAEADRDWLRQVAIDGTEPARRLIGVQALILVWLQQGRPDAGIEALLEVVRDDTNLTSLIEAWVRPPEADPTIEDFNRRERERLAEAAANEEKRLADWSAWREGLIADPDGAFAPLKRLETIATLYKWLNMREHDSIRYNAWDEHALTSAFGSNIAALARAAFKELWRQERPVLWSDRTSENRNSTLYSWIYGLCGIAAEAASHGWAGRLTAADARLATEYATIEINGLPSWLKDLVDAHPSEVEAVLGSGLEAELRLAAELQHLPLLQSIAYGDSALKSLLAPRLIRLLVAWPTKSAEEEQATASSARHLTEVLQILEADISSQERQLVLSICEARFKSDLTNALGMVWLRGIFRWAPDRGAAALERGLAGASEEQRATLATAALAELLGDRGGPSFDLGSFDERAKSLGALVRLAYEFVRPADDQRHDDVYTPNARDEAERARGFLLSALLDTPGAEAQQILVELAGSPAFAENPDRLRLLARERAAKDAEHGAFIPAEFVALEQRYEAPPHDRDGLFEVMVDRVDDLAADIANHDFTDRRTLQRIVEEVEMQRTLALRLEGLARGAYTVTREAEVADAKRTDIRLAAVRGDQKATIEIKIADKGWSVNELELALREQLVGQYLCHESCKAGCLLLTYNGDKKYWEHPGTGASMTFNELTGHLAALARTIEAEQGHAVRLSIRGLDLRNPS